jgi:N,N'-diacetyllegionaminate synthase
MTDNVFVVAEMACSHEGDMQLAINIIDGASKARADAVQLQIWSLVHMMSPQRKEYELLQRLEFTQDEWVQLVKYTRDKYPDLKIYVCVYEHASIEFIDNLGIDGYKLNSSDLSNPLVLDKVAATGKPINLSVGASTLAEIQSAIERIQKNTDSPITLMYGHQSFPTKPENVHMNFMGKLKKLFELPIGYQDHCDADDESAFWLPAASLGMGVDVLEKHITHDRSYKGIDHESALDPDEFVRFVEMVRTIEKAKGISTPRSFSKDEIKYREFQKKSIVAAHDLNKGTVITTKDLNFMRAETLGYSPTEIDSVIGKVTTKDIKAFQLISKNNVS